MALNEHVAFWQVFAFSRPVEFYAQCQRLPAWVEQSDAQDRSASEMTEVPFHQSDLKQHGSVLVRLRTPHPSWIDFSPNYIRGIADV